MKYAMSDLHGRYDKYTDMLRKINFADTDELYILGDICDRGTKAAQIYLDIMKRDNIHCIMGNHEKMLLENLPSYFGFLRDGGWDPEWADCEIWSANGGAQTCLSLIKMGKEQIIDIYNYIRSLPWYRIVEANNRRYLLIHAGIDNYDQTKPVDAYWPDELVWSEIDHDESFYPNEFDKIIVGHVPTFEWKPDGLATIYRGKGNVVDIDCGAFFEDRGGRLGCLCLDTMKEFYV